MGVHILLGGFPSDLGTGEVNFSHRRLKTVISLRNRRGAEGIRLHDIASRFEVGAMDAPDYLRPSDREEIIIPLQIVTMILESLAPEVRLGKRMLLDHRPHRTVKEGNASGEKLSQVCFGCVERELGLHGDQGLERRLRHVIFSRWIKGKQSRATEMSE